MKTQNRNIGIGLDIGNRRISMVKLARATVGAWRLLDFAILDVNPQEGRTGKLSQLEKLVRTKGLAGQRVNIGVSGEAVIVRYIDLPKMSKSEIGRALEYEAQQYIPFKMEEVVFDYYLLGSIGTNPERVKVLLVAATKEIVTAYIELIGQAGLKPRLIDVNSFSLINCFQANGPKVETDNPYALINLEFDLVNIDILQREIPFFTREISFFDASLSFGRGLKPRDFPAATGPMLMNLIREMRLSIDYYESEFERQVQTIYLSGTGAKMKQLIGLFSAQLGREVKSWDPLKNLIIDSTQIDRQALEASVPTLALACGLALRTA